MTLLGLQVSPSELAVGVCPASLLKSLFHGLILSPPIREWRSGATPGDVGPRRAPKSCPGCMGRNQVLLHRGGQLLSPRTLGPTSMNRTDRGRCIAGVSGAFPDASASPEAAGEAPALQPLPLTHALPPEAPVLLQPTTSMLAWDAGVGSG